MDAGKKCTAKVSVNDVYPSNAYDAVWYKKDATPVVNEVSPKYHNTNGGKELIIKGQRFANTAKVLVDGVDCPV